MGFNFHKTTYLRAIVLALVVMFVLLGIGWQVSGRYEARLMKEARASVHMMLVPYSTALTSTIHRRIALLRGLEAFVRAGFSQAEITAGFVDFASSLHAGRKEIRYFALAPGGIIQHIYPPAHSGLLGGDLVRDIRPEIRESVRRAIRTGEIRLNGPYALKRNGLGVVACLAIKRDREFWGIATMVLDLGPLLKDAGIAGGVPGMQLALLDRRDRVIYSEREITDFNPVRLPVELPGETWTLAAIPAAGWVDTINGPLRDFRGAGLMIIGLFSVLVFLVTAQQVHLRSAVVSRTRDLDQELREHRQAELSLKKSEERYRRLYNSIRDGLLVVDMDRTMADCNPAFAEMFGYTPDEIRGKSTRVICESDEEFRRFGKALEANRDKPNFFYSIRFRKKNGEVFPAEVNLVYLRDKTGTIIGYMGMSRDITQQAAALAALREREEQFRTLTELAPTSVTIIGGEHTDEYLYVNSAWEQLTGYTKADIQMLRPIDLVRPEMRKAIIDKKNARLRGEPVESRYEMPIIRKDGQTRWIDFSAALSTYQGEPVIIGMANDITDQKMTAEALRNSEAMYRNLFEHAPMGIFRSSSGGRFLNVNPELARILGCRTPEQVIRHYHNLGEQLYMDPEQRNAVIGILSEKGSVEKFEFEALRVDGSRIWIFVNARMGERLPDGSFVIEGFVSDITAARRANDRILHLNRILRSMQDIDRLIAREKDEEFFIRQVCALLVKNQGYLGAMIVLLDSDGRPCRSAQAGMPEPLATMEEMLELGQIPLCCQGIKATPESCKACPAVHSCTPDDLICTRLEYDDHFYGYIAVSIFRVAGEIEEEHSLFTQTASDVAFALYNMEREKQKQDAEHARERAEEQLQQAQKMEAIGRLAGGVAHDFNNMLNVILGYAGIIRNRMDKNDPMYGYVLEIEQAAQRSAELTSHLLAFSRKQITEPRMIDLNEIIEDQLTMLNRLIGEKIEIRFLPAEDLWNIRVDPFQVDQVLTNLTVNSRDAIEEMGTVTIRTENIILQEENATELPAGDYVLLTFSDTGTGMDTQTLEQIFEPFFTTKAVGKGTGLGLSTVYGIVKQNRGAIEVTSESGAGTTFRIYFPRYLAGDETWEVHPEAESLRGDETVLIVEDEEQVLNLAAMILSEHGYNVLKARTPGEALRMAREHGNHIRLLLTDVIMPEMNGRQLSRKVEEINPGIRTLFMSGYTDDVIAEQGIIEPAADLIVKPFTVPLLTGKIREVLDR